MNGQIHDEAKVLQKEAGNKEGKREAERIKL